MYISTPKNCLSNPDKRVKKILYCPSVITDWLETGKQANSDLGEKKKHNDTLFLYSAFQT